jgi:hypothetical protein
VVGVLHRKTRALLASAFPLNFKVDDLWAALIQPCSTAVPPSISWIQAVILSAGLNHKNAKKQFFCWTRNTLLRSSQGFEAIG